MRRFIVMAVVVMVAGSVWLPSSAKATTPVGGVLASDTTWTAANSPYLVTSTVQVPEGVTLTIDPGVVVEASAGLADMFLVHGTLRAIGTASTGISFDGAGSANFFSAKSSPGTMLVHVEYADISDGNGLWPPTGYAQYGHLILRHSRISDLNHYSYIWYPEQDVFIEHNVFVNTPGFSIGHSHSDVYIRWNRFVSLGEGYSAYPAWIANWAAYDTSQTVVTQNVFGAVPAGKYVLYLPPGYPDTAIDGASNYWGTMDESVVEARIFDENDDITVAGEVSYQPLLSSPPAGVPPEPMLALSVSKVGDGTGLVSSDPAGIDCGDTCSGDFVMGSSVTLTAAASEGSVFAGWAGDCEGKGSCAVAMDDEMAVTARFELERYSHGRTVSLALKRHLTAKGTVRSGGPSACRSDVPVAIQRRVSGSWKRIKSGVTNANGVYTVAMRDKPGRYRATVTRDSLDKQNTCLSSRSGQVRHRH